MHLPSQNCHNGSASNDANSIRRGTAVSKSKFDAEFLDRNPYPERFFTLASVILGAFGAIISGWTVFQQSLPTWFIFAKDVSIYISLLILTLFFFLRFRQAVSVVERQRSDHSSQIDTIRQIVNQQVEVYSQLMDHTRESFYGNVGSSIYERRFNYTNQELNELLENSLNSVLMSVGTLLKSQLSAKGFTEIPQLSLSVKAFVTGSMVADLCRLSEETTRGLNPDERYIITLDRDSETKLYRKEREVRKRYYTINENTEFYRISVNDLSDFTENNLLKLEALKQYRNSNPDWRNHYTATQAVPIWHHDETQTTIFGFLTVDALNPNEEEFFDRKSTRSIMMFGADLLALLFLTLDMYDRLPIAEERETAG